MSDERRFDSDDYQSAIAVIGMAGRFPGARTLEELWANVREGVESIRFFDDDELRAAGETEERLRNPRYVRACPRLEGIDQFDAGFFGMSPRDAAVFDPQHRFFLECAWEAFERAGYVAERSAGPVGVFASCGFNEYLVKNVLANADVVASVGEWLIRHTGNDASFLATRTSFELGLRGPSLNVQTACSSSLVAIHLACQSLLGGECDMALAGGSTIAAEQNKGYLHAEGEILSPDGHCRPFDAKSAGTLSSSATGCVVLKRLADALRDGDDVLAILRGSAINNDGNDKVSYLAPSASGQARVVAEALAVAGVAARDIGYVEAHGTGTLLGDPIEVAGITEAFRATTPDVGFCALGSLKGNIGHAGEAAGVAGFIKTVLALRHAEIPPSLHFETPNPKASLPTSPFYVPTKATPWPKSAKPRRAGVTGLGAGGTNAHVILEEGPTRPALQRVARPELLLLSARSATALDAASRALGTHLAEHPELALADVAFTLGTGRKAFRHRRAVVARDGASAIAALAASDPRKAGAPATAPSVVFLFPGGGAQYASMGRDLYDSEPVYRRAIDECSESIRAELGGVDLREVMFPRANDVEEGGAPRIERPSLALPALFATEHALTELLRSWGVVPRAMIGHSAGEYAAACVAGVITVREALSLVALRGRLFETLPKGAMLGVSLPLKETRAYMDDSLSIAALNGPSSTVASGPLAAIAAMEARLRESEIESQRLHIDVAAHSAMLEPILAEFAAFCRTIRWKAPRTPFVSNVTGTWITTAEATDPAYWTKHLRSTVLFDAGIRTILTDPNRALVEIGPGRTLGSLARQQPDCSATIVATLRHPKEAASDVGFLLASLGKVWSAGVDVDAAALFPATRARRVLLPTYPFERQRYWIEPSPAAPRLASASSVGKRPDLADWFYVPRWERSLTPTGTLRAPGPWLVLTDGSLFADALIEGLSSSGEPVIPVTIGASFARTEAGYVVDPASEEGFDALAADLHSRGVAPANVVHLWGLDGAFRKPRWLPSFGRGPLADYDDRVARHHRSLVLLARALGRDGRPFQLTAVSSGMQRVAGEPLAHPDKALLLGAVRVIPREYPQIATASVDLDAERSPARDRRLAARLVTELSADIVDRAVAYRGDERWVERLAPIRLEGEGNASGDPLASLGEGVVALVTGGLGGLGLAVAGAIARRPRAKLVLVTRTALPPEASWAGWLAARGADDETSRKIRGVEGLRAAGAEVVIEVADVADRAAMEAVVARTRRAFGAIEAVVHTAGVLSDALIALSSTENTARVLDAKVKGALVLDEVLRAAPPALFVLFSSVSSVLGLPGQADYTAANAFLDAFAQHVDARGETRAIAIGWNAWQEVGMAAKLARDARAATSGRETAHPALARVVTDGDVVRFTTPFSRATHWLVGEHVVRGGDALLPGTGFLELARAAFEQGVRGGEASAIELRDVFFLAPFAVAEGETRALEIDLDTKSGELVLHSGDAETSPHVTARARRVSIERAPRRDLALLRARCTAKTEVFEGEQSQAFMDFGPRWSCLRRIDYGDREAVATLALPSAFVGDLATYRLHPALLDMATGCAQALIPGFDPTRTFYVPLSYGRVLVRAPLTAKLVSHLRLRESDASGVAVFDVSLCNEAGDELVAIEGYTMRLLDASVVLAKRDAAARRSESSIDDALRDGMLSSEGVEAFARIIARPVSARVVACSIDLHAWLARVDEAARVVAPTSADAGPLFDRPQLGTDFVAPRTAIERELAAIWRELLGVEQIGVDDDFFELGGQSLVAVRLFNRIRTRMGVELPLATLFEAPTIGAAAALIAPLVAQVESAKPAAVTENARPVELERRHFRSLVPIRRGSGLRPFFCVHGAGGNVLNFRDLSRALERRQPFYGLQARGVDGVLRPHETLEEMATAYLEEIRSVQAEGPYLLGGYSGGGAVAFEMAQQLTAAGERVGLLAFIDTFHPQMHVRRVTMSMRFERLRDEGVPYLEGAVRGQLERRARRAAQAKVAALLAAGAPIPPELRDIHLTQAFEVAAAKYRPKPWAGSATLFRAEEVAYVFQGGGPSYGWGDVVLGGIDIVAVPGNHDTLLLEPSATILVRSLGKALARAQRDDGEGVDDAKPPHIRLVSA